MPDNITIYTFDLSYITSILFAFSLLSETAASKANNLNPVKLQWMKNILLLSLLALGATKLKSASNHHFFFIENSCCPFVSSISLCSVMFIIVFFGPSLAQLSKCIREVIYILLNNNNSDDVATSLPPISINSSLEFLLSGKNEPLC